MFLFSKLFMYLVVGFNLFSSFLCLSSKKKLFFWLCLELNLYSTIPLILKNVGLSKFKPVFVYFITQSFGSLLMFFFLVFPQNYFFGFFGVLLKLGLFPFFFLLPYICGELSWITIFVVLVLKKIPMFFFFRKKIDFEEDFFIIMKTLTMVFSSVAMWSNSGLKVKNFLTWSSMKNACFLLFLKSVSLFLFFWYFFFYSLLLLVLSVFGEKYKMSDWKNKKSPMKKNNYFIFFSMIFFFSGMPPFLVFFYKMLFILCIVSYTSLVSFIVIIFSFIFSFLGYYNFFLIWFPKKMNFFSKKIFLSFVFFLLFLGSFMMILS